MTGGLDATLGLRLAASLNIGSLRSVGVAAEKLLSFVDAEVDLGEINK
jgi:hypothetical protein